MHFEGVNGTDLGRNDIILVYHRSIITVRDQQETNQEMNSTNGCSEGKGSKWAIFVSTMACPRLECSSCNAMCFTVGVEAVQVAGSNTHRFHRVVADS